MNVVLMKKPLLLFLATIAFAALTAWAPSAQAYTFWFGDEYYISSSSVFNTTFAGRTSGSFSSTGIYEWTQDHTTVTRVGSATGGNVPGIFMKDTTPNAANELMLFGWGGSYNNGYAVDRPGYGLLNLQNPNNGSVLYFRYNVGGSGSAFDFNSFDLRSLSNLSFTLEGFRNGTMVYSDILNVTGGDINTYHTFAENWGNVDTIMIASTAGLPVNWGSGTLYMDNVRINEALPATTMPEPASMALMGLGLAGVAFRRKKA